MLAEFKHTLRRMRWQIVGWSAGVAIYAVMMAYLFPNIVDMGDAMNEYINMFPKAMSAFFENIYAIGTPMGYLDVYFFSYMHLIIAILAISAGAALLVGDEENGVLDLMLAQPVSRTQMFFGRFLGLSTALVIIQIVGWLSWAIPSGSVGIEYSWLELLLPFLPLLSILLLFTAIALFLSLILPAARIASMLTGALLVGNYLFMGLSNLNEKLQPFMKYTPLNYYQGGVALEGLKGNWLFGLLLSAVLFMAAAWLLFLRRDIRVGGERSWKLPALMLRSRSQ